MKTKMVCHVAHKDDTRLGPLNDADNDVKLRGLDLRPVQDHPLPELVEGDTYLVEITITKL